jgi:predicted amidophosphoribosyltransferase
MGYEVGPYGGFWCSIKQRICFGGDCSRCAPDYVFLKVSYNCPHCGGLVETGDKFCKHCGKSLVVGAGT